MIMWIISQVAVPHATKKPTNWWAVVIHDEGFSRCGRCINALYRAVFTTFNRQDKVVARMAYSKMKHSLYIWTVPGKDLDTTLLGELLRKQGVKDYEILH